MTTLFYQEYSSESLFDLCRDVTECFDPVYNKTALALNEESSILVVFNYFFEDGTIKELLNSTYYHDNFHEVEDNLFYSVEKINDQKDEHGFHPGEFKLTITINE